MATREWNAIIDTCFRVYPYKVVSTSFLCLEIIGQARIQRGDQGSGTPPPLRFVRGGVLCRGLMSRRGGPKVVFNLLLTFFFWLASLASIIQTYYIYQVRIYSPLLTFSLLLGKIPLCRLKIIPIRRDISMWISFPVWLHF